MDEFGERIGKWANNPQNIENVRESCPFNVVMHGSMGFAFGGLLGMFLASMSAGGTSPEAQLLNPTADVALKSVPLRIQVKSAMTDLVKRSWGNAKNFAAIAALYSGSECIIEGVKISSPKYRAKHDIFNSVAAGCFTGGVLSAKGGPKSALVGCAGFAAFSVVIEQFMKEK